jgi:hypothetical protein
MNAELEPKAIPDDFDVTNKRLCFLPFSVCIGVFGGRCTLVPLTTAFVYNTFKLTFSSKNVM